MKTHLITSHHRRRILLKELENFLVGLSGIRLQPLAYLRIRIFFFAQRIPLPRRKKIFVYLNCRQRRATTFPGSHAPGRVVISEGPFLQAGFFMFITLQYPLFDNRLLTNDLTRSLQPDWQEPHAKSQVRYFGEIMTRDHQYLGPWDDEKMYCRSNSVINICGVHENHYYTILHNTPAQSRIL
ncbi:MAG: hypothetical protein ABI151_11515, partial [Chitinophagaceae bacterium]